MKMTFILLMVGFVCSGLYEADKSINLQLDAIYLQQEDVQVV